MTAVSVTAGHIARGKRQDAERCAIALALHDVFPDAEYIMVSGDGITLQPCTDDAWMAEAEIMPPPEVAAFVEAFDDGNDVEPFTFELDYPAATP
jgi:hypothetical protein